MQGWAGDAAKYYLEEWRDKYRRLANLWCMYILAVKEHRTLEPEEQTSPWLLFTSITDVKGAGEKGADDKNKTPKNTVAFRYLFGEDMDFEGMNDEEKLLSEKADEIKEKWKGIENKLRNTKERRLAFTIVARSKFEKWDAAIEKDEAGITLHEKLRRVSTKPSERYEFFTELCKTVTAEDVDKVEQQLKEVEDVCDNFPFLLFPFARANKWLSRDVPKMEKYLKRPKPLPELAAKMIKNALQSVTLQSVTSMDSKTQHDLAERVWAFTLVGDMEKLDEESQSIKDLKVLCNRGSGEELMGKLAKAGPESSLYILTASVLLNPLWTCNECGETRRCVEEEIGRGPSQDVGRRTTYRTPPKGRGPQGLLDKPGLLDKAKKKRVEGFPQPRQFPQPLTRLGTPEEEDEAEIDYLLTHWMMKLVDHKDRLENAFNTVMRTLETVNSVSSPPE
uniref:Uncharacterized protein n=1 Tax=Haptolina ericina TaxID=156174 RepID=A0A7S3ALY1_9EUKA